LETRQPRDATHGRGSWGPALQQSRPLACSALESSVAIRGTTETVDQLVRRDIRSRWKKSVCRRMEQPPDDACKAEKKECAPRGGTVARCFEIQRFLFAGCGVKNKHTPSVSDGIVHHPCVDGGQKPGASALPDPAWRLCHASARQIPREALKRGGSAGDWFSVSLLFPISSFFLFGWLAGIYDDGIDFCFPIYFCFRWFSVCNSFSCCPRFLGLIFLPDLALLADFNQIYENLNVFMGLQRDL
jgi:hypothetical protein